MRQTPRRDVRWVQVWKAEWREEEGLRGGAWQVRLVDNGGTQTRVSEENPHVIKSQSLTRNPERSFKYSENDISS